ncbi:unnamed protein product, partial [Hapterophycus canaliculatus]
EFFCVGFDALWRIPLLCRTRPCVSLALRWPAIACTRVGLSEHQPVRVCPQHGLGSRPKPRRSHVGDRPGPPVKEATLSRRRKLRSKPLNSKASFSASCEHWTHLTLSVPFEKIALNTKANGSNSKICRDRPTRVRLLANVIPHDIFSRHQVKEGLPLYFPAKQSVSTCPRKCRTRRRHRRRRRRPRCLKQARTKTPHLRHPPP